MSHIAVTTPYLMEEWPKSDGRTFLAHAFSFFCTLEWGYSFEEIDAALNGEAGGTGAGGQIRGAAQDLGRVLQQGRIQTYARPFGGGTPRLLAKDMWELDDFTGRFGSSAINPADPFGPAAELTHWIFVDTAQFDGILGIVQGDAHARRPAPRQPLAVTNPQAGSCADSGSTTLPDRYLRKADVLKLVPMSRSTFDDRVRRGLFPSSVDLGGGIVVWWESEVHAWMRGKGGRFDAESG